MKKVLFSLFFILGAFFVFCTVKVSATDTGVVTLTDGASIRTGSPNGLKFEATVSGEFEGGSISYGFVLTRGTFTKDEVVALAAAKKVEVDCGEPNEANKYYVTITNIPAEGYTGPVTALAYVKVDGVNRYSDISVTRNLLDTARAEYNRNDEPSELITTIMGSNKIKVTHSNGTFNYYSTLAKARDAGFLVGDTLDIIRGSYNTTLTISVNNFTITGAQKDQAINNDGTRTNGKDETIISTTITVNDDVKNFSINGVKLTGTNIVNLIGSHNGVSIQYCNLQFSGYYGIKDSAAAEKTLEDANQDNIVISNNYFCGTKDDYTRDIYLQGPLSSLEVTNNYFASKATTLNDDGYCVKCNRLASTADINVKDNIFRQYNASYLIDFGYTANEGGSINIENNEMSSSSSYLVGSGIRVANLKDTSSVSIIHNTNFMVSRYYNAILLSCGTAANDTTANNPTVDIRFNQFYGDPVAEKPESRELVETNYIRIGLGIPEEPNANLVIGYNYFSTGTSRYAYTANNSNKASKNTNQRSLITNSNTVEDSDDRYLAYKVSLLP